jgi:hypothetical protein
MDERTGLQCEGGNARCIQASTFSVMMLLYGGNNDAGLDDAYQWNKICSFYDLARNNSATHGLNS